MKCPVCRNYCDTTAHSCVVCGFDRINMDFLNIDDAEAWKRDVKVAKLIWFMDENNESFKRRNPGCNTIERTILQLNTYFSFNEQLEYITKNPNNLTARSWFIDSLREIYVLTGTYPVTSRKYVRQIIEEHMDFFERTTLELCPKREYILCEHLVHKAEMALADCDFSNAFRYYQQYLLGIKRLKENDYLSQISEAARCVLHNCLVLCELLAVEPRICVSIKNKINEFYSHDYYNSAEGQALLQKIKKHEYSALYVHTLGCGLCGAYYTEKDDLMSSEIQNHVATIESCAYYLGESEHYYAHDLSLFGCELCHIELVHGFELNDGLMYRIEYITDAFSISEAIYMHQNTVEQLAKKLTTIQGLFD